MPNANIEATPRHLFAHSPRVCSWPVKNSEPPHSFLFRYTWQKNGKPYDWQVYDDRISQQPGRGTLVITSPRDEDIGMYRLKIILLSPYVKL